VIDAQWEMREKKKPKTIHVLNKGDNWYNGTPLWHYNGQREQVFHRTIVEYHSVRFRDVAFMSHTNSMGDTCVSRLRNMNFPQDNRMSHKDESS